MINRKQTTPLILVLTLLFSGCELMGPELHKKLPLEPVVQEDLIKETEVVYQELSNESTDKADDETIKAELYPGTGQFISPVAGTKKGKAAGKGEYSLNFTANFITQKIVEAELLDLDNFLDSKNLDEKIVFIQSADPGYDYIFSNKIAGLITQYGGINSHMAIRCNELQIPAAIGVGKELFLSLKNGSLAILDCSNKKIHVF